MIVNDGRDRWVARVATVPAKDQLLLRRSDLSMEAGGNADLLSVCRAHWTGFGMTEAEATAIVAAWEPDLLNTIGVLVISRMPRDVYDQMFPLTISPKPGKIVRVGMVFDALASQAERAKWLPCLKRTLEQLGRELGDDEQKVRAAAERRLSRMGDLARPSLERWVESDDVEVASTARSLLEPIKAHESATRMHDAWQKKSQGISVLGTSPPQPVR